MIRGDDVLVVAADERVIERDGRGRLILAVVVLLHDDGAAGGLSGQAAEGDGIRLVIHVAHQGIVHRHVAGGHWDCGHGLGVVEVVPYYAAFETVCICRAIGVDVEDFISSRNVKIRSVC